MKVWGPFACFTQPEFKAERRSYPVITPSAARGILEAIFWKPEIYYEISEILVLSPGRPSSVRRNEISERQGGAEIAVESHRQLRTSLVLIDVAYGLRARVCRREWARDALASYIERFQRRTRRGQCFQRPYLGVREFAADFAPLEPDAIVAPVDAHYGRMLLDIAFIADERRTELSFQQAQGGRRRMTEGHARSVYFDAECCGGVLRVPPSGYEHVRRLERDGLNSRSALSDTSLGR